MLELYPPSTCPLAWAPKSAQDFEQIIGAVRTVATKGTSQSDGNYLFLLYIISIFEDDQRKVEEKRTNSTKETKKDEESDSDEAQSIFDILVSAPGVDRSAKRMLMEAAMACFIDNSAEAATMGKTRSNKIAQVKTAENTNITVLDNYLSIALCMRVLEFVLGSSPSMEEFKFDLWSIFKNFKGAAKIVFLQSFNNHNLKLELLNFFLDNYDTPKDRTKSFNTKLVSHAKIIQHVFNTRPIVYKDEDVTGPEIFVHLVYHLVTSWLWVSDQSEDRPSTEQYKELYDNCVGFIERLAMFHHAQLKDAEPVIKKLKAICKVKTCT